MKKLLVVIGFLFVSYSCRSQELYIVIDTRDTVNIQYDVSTYKNPEYVEGGYDIDYFIRRDDPAEDYGGGVLLTHYPYSDSVLKNWEKIKKLRTKNISEKQWEKLKRKKNVKVVDGIEWVRTTPWDTLYKQRIQYFFKGNMYVIDKKFATQDSVQIRGVEFEDTRAQE